MLCVPTSKKSYQFEVTVGLEELSSVPFVNGVMFAKLRILDTRNSKQYSTRQSIINHVVSWNSIHKFVCRIFANIQTSMLDHSQLKVSIRKETKGGKSYLKMGYVIVNISCFANLGNKPCRRRYILEGYNQDRRQDNSMLQMTFTVCQLFGDPCFRVPDEDMSKCVPYETLPASTTLLMQHSPNSSIDDGIIMDDMLLNRAGDTAGVTSISNVPITVSCNHNTTSAAANNAAITSVDLKDINADDYNGMDEFTGDICYNDGGVIDPDCIDDRSIGDTESGSTNQLDDNIYNQLYSRIQQKPIYSLDSPSTTTSSHTPALFNDVWSGQPPSPPIQKVSSSSNPSADESTDDSTSLMMTLLMSAASQTVPKHQSHNQRQQMYPTSAIQLQQQGYSTCPQPSTWQRCHLRLASGSTARTLVSPNAINPLSVTPNNIPTGPMGSSSFATNIVRQHQFPSNTNSHYGSTVTTATTATDPRTLSHSSGYCSHSRQSSTGGDSASLLLSFTNTSKSAHASINNNLDACDELKDECKDLLS